MGEEEIAVDIETARPFEIDIGRLRIIPWHEYRQFLSMRQHNWIDFHVVWLHAEWASYKETFELNLGLLGLCCCIEWYYGERT